MREKLNEGGVPIPKYKLCRNYDELIEAAKDIGTPCVAKPVGGNASYGTFMIQNNEDVDELEEKYNASIEYLKMKAVDEDMFSFSKEEMDIIGVLNHVDMVTDYIVEEYMEGPEISVDALVQNGKVTIMGIEDQIRMEPPYFLQLAARLPYVCTDEEMAVIQDLIERTVNAMDIKNSATHTEIIFTPEGPKIVEIGCRIGGDDLHDTILHVTGYNLMFESVMIALGMERDYIVETKYHTMMKFLMPHKKGVIEEVFIPEDVKSDPDIFSIDLLMDKGEDVDTPPKSFNYIGYVGAKGATPKDAENKINEAFKKIRVKIND